MLRSGRPWRRIATPRAAFVMAAVVAVTAFGVAKFGRGSEPPSVAPISGGLSGYLFQDRNDNGSRDDGEPLLGGRLIEVFGAGPIALQSGTTAPDGSFAFRDLAEHGTTLKVRVVPVMEGPASVELPDATRLSEFRDLDLGVPAAVGVPSFRTCPELERCPDLALPDLMPLSDIDGSEEYVSPRAWTLDETSEPGRRLLRVASATANRGGIMHLVAGEPDGETRPVIQRVYGQRYVYERTVGSFVFHPEHSHFHVADYLEMRLIEPRSGAVVARSDKLSFCLTDVLTIEDVDQDLVLDLPPFECGLAEQGINPGRADYYGPDLPDQYIDVSDVPPGEYELEFQVDPSQRFLDADRENNRARLPVSVPAS